MANPQKTKEKASKIAKESFIIMMDFMQANKMPEFEGKYVALYFIAFAAGLKEAGFSDEYVGHLVDKANADFKNLIQK
jgi:hypothetical protein